MGRGRCTGGGRENNPGSKFFKSRKREKERETTQQCVIFCKLKSAKDRKPRKKKGAENSRCMARCKVREPGGMGAGAGRYGRNGR